MRKHISRVDITTSRGSILPPYHTTDVKSRYRHVLLAERLNGYSNEREIWCRKSWWYQMPEDALLEGHLYVGLKVYPEIN